MKMQPVKGKDSLGIDEGKDEDRDTDGKMGDKELRRFFTVLGLVSALDILKSLQKGEKQFMEFLSIASSRTAYVRTKELIKLGIIEHHLEKEPKRKEWYTLTERGKRVLRALIRLEKEFQEK